MDAAEERDLRLDRRLRLLLRMILYPMALLTIGLAWQHRHAGVDGSDPTTIGWHATSSQGLAITMRTDTGWLVSARIPIRLRCPDGVVQMFIWTPSSEIYRPRGDTTFAHRPLTYAAGSDPYRYEGWATFHLGDHPTGTARMTWTDARDLRRCAGSVTFRFSKD